MREAAAPVSGYAALAKALGEAEAQPPAADEGGDSA